MARQIRRVKWYNTGVAMKHLLIVLCLGLALAVHASARVVVPSLPEAVRPDAEVSTNIALNVNAARLQTLTLSVDVERVRFDIRIR